MGSGGGAGAIPGAAPHTYLTDPWSWLATNGAVAGVRPATSGSWELMTDINDARTDQGGNPFTDLDAYDPEGELSAMQTQVDLFKGIVDGLDPPENWFDLFQKASSAEGSIISDIDVSELPAPNTITVSSVNIPLLTAPEKVLVSDIDVVDFTVVSSFVTLPTTVQVIPPGISVGGLVSAYADRQDPEFNQGVSRLTAGRVDINGTDGNALMMALANMENQYNREKSAINEDLTWKAAQIEFGAELQVALDYTTKQLDIDLTQYRSKVAAGIRKQELTVQASIEDERLEFASGKQKFNGDLAAASQDQSLNFQSDNEMRRLMIEEGIGKRELIQASRIERRRLVVQSTIATMTLSTQFVADSVKVMTGLRINSLELERIVTSVIMDLEKTYVVTRQEQKSRNIEFDVKDAMWDVELYAGAGKYISSIMGSAPGSTIAEMSKFESALSGSLAGATAGATIGAQIGAAGGPIGAGAGAAIGAGVGLVAGLV